MARMLVRDPKSGMDVFRETRLTGRDWLDMADEMLAALPMQTAKHQEYYDLAGGSGEEDAPYTEALARIKEVKKLLDIARVQLEALQRHAHDWNDNDYCAICGADGRA